MENLEGQKKSAYVDDKKKLELSFCLKMWSIIKKIALNSIN